MEKEVEKKKVIFTSPVTNVSNNNTRMGMTGGYKKANSHSDLMNLYKDPKSEF